MDSAVFIQMIIFVSINAFTPGPGNILALNTVTSVGVKKGKPLFIGTFVGYYVVHILCAVFVYALSSVLPGFLSVMKYIGAVYIVWLAVSIVRSKPAQSNNGQSVSFMRGFTLSLVNVKKWMFGMTALTGYIMLFYDTLHMYILYEVLIATIGTVATLVWIITGSLLQNYYEKYYRIINVVLAAVLLQCAYSMLF